MYTVSEWLCHDLACLDNEHCRLDYTHLKDPMPEKGKVGLDEENVHDIEEVKQMIHH